MKIGFIGAGKVGTTFGIYLKNNGFNIYGYNSRTKESGETSAKLTDSQYYSIYDLSHGSDIIFITTGDDEIENVIDRLADNNLLKEGQIIAHMSGASSSDILKRAKKKGCFVYSIHPLQSFADIKKGVEDLKDTVFSIEGDKEKIDLIEDILNRCGNKYFEITKEQKSIYHATACVVSNYLVTLMDYGLSLFKSIGIDKDDGFKALYPLIDGTIKNIYGLGTEKALTGPISRGDIKTIERHINSLKDDKEKLKLYKILGLETLQLAEKEKLKDGEKISNLKNILKEGV
ncbi:Rossmann-like and DUF2520 domain-containing protein [Dethiothermospora halolimnae]|uniref:Rossmann-like and DUF2520 domain-containing protein n=1 Tax=Dethiothermospora halolimnae TaxID=3114390 RepID=UPI003CCC363C